MQRKHFLGNINRAFKLHPVVALLGPRQCGKTTLAKSFAKKYESKYNIHYFDLEDPRYLLLLEQAMLALEELSGFVIIDEIQRRPELFPILRVLCDRRPIKTRFLILGSASRDLLQQSSESLAGRIQYIELTPFNLREVKNSNRLWLRGGFPLSYLAKNNSLSNDWRDAYISTFLERDIPNLGIKIPAKTLRRFWMTLTHYHGQIFNASEIGQSLGFAHTTIRHYLDILTGTFMIRQLQPWLENIQKRQIKAPKIYFRDSGIYHSLSGIDDKTNLIINPKLGASWEGFALEEIIRFHNATSEECYFWGIHTQAELDLLIIKNGKRLGFEFKYADAPTLTKSLQHAMHYLQLDQAFMITPGTHSFPLTPKIRVVGIEKYLKTL